jgi:MoxR-like ATPase
VLGREYVVPDDVKTLFGPALAHRVIPKVMPESLMSMTEWKTRIVTKIVEALEVPT